MANVNPHDLMVVVEHGLEQAGAKSVSSMLSSGLTKLLRRNKTMSDPARVVAEQNTLLFTNAFGAIIEASRVRGALSEEDLALALSSPAISRSLETAILSASETSDPIDIARFRSSSRLESVLAKNLRFRYCFRNAWT